jgi:hypothetical protein
MLLSEPRSQRDPSRPKYCSVWMQLQSLVQPVYRRAMAQLAPRAAPQSL